MTFDHEQRAAQSEIEPGSPYAEKLSALSERFFEGAARCWWIEQQISQLSLRFNREADYFCLRDSAAGSILRGRNNEIADRPPFDLGSPPQDRQSFGCDPCFEPGRSVLRIRSHI